MGSMKLNVGHRYVAELDLPEGSELPATIEFQFYAGPDEMGADGGRGSIAKDRRKALTQALKSAGYPLPRRVRATRITHLATGSVVSEKGQA